MLYNKQFTVGHKALWWGDSKVSDSEIVFPVKIKQCNNCAKCKCNR